MTRTRKLSAQEANRLAVQLQVLRIKVLEFALKYSFNGKSYCWGQVVDKHTLTREKIKLAELYRIKTIHETTIRNLPYIAGVGSKVDKIKEHYLADEGTIGFIEVKDNSHGRSVVNHLWSKRTIKRRIKKKQSSSNKKLKKMGTRRRAVKPQDEDLLGFDTNVEDLLGDIDEQIVVYKAGDKVAFVHAGGKVQGSVIKSGLSEGRVKVADKVGTVYMVWPKDILLDGETATQLIARTKQGGKRPVYESHQEETPKKSKAEKQKDLAAQLKGNKKAEENEKSWPKKKSGNKSQKELVEELAEKGERDYDVIAEKTGVTRVNVGQYMYRWKKANKIK